MGNAGLMRHRGARQEKRWKAKSMDPILINRRLRHWLAQHWLFLLLLIAYCSIVLPHLTNGVGTLDAHGIMHVVDLLASGHGVAVSRPPGHPTTEFYIFGAVAWLLRHAFGLDFSDEVYLALQFMAGAACLVLFYRLLCRLRFAPTPAALAALCLALSPQYLANSLDGEEFLYAMLFLLLALRFLIDSDKAGHDVRSLSICLSVFAFALATGCRPEAVIAGIMYPLWFGFHPKLTWRSCVLAAAFLVASVFAVWWPVLLFHHVSPPTGSGVSPFYSILGAGYKLAFQFFTLPVFFLIMWCGIIGLKEYRSRLTALFPANFLYALSLVVTISFILFFLIRSDKPSYFLCAFPFLLLIVLNRSKRLLASMAVLTVISCVVQVDIFRDRVLSSPYLTSGSYERILAGKPYRKGNYLEYLVAKFGTTKTVVVANAWPWDFSYQIKRGALDLKPQAYQDAKAGVVDGFLLNDNCIILSRQGVTASELLTRYKQEGYDINVDANLYRTLFYKLDFKSKFAMSAKIGNLPVYLFADGETPDRQVMQ